MMLMVVDEFHNFIIILLYFISVCRPSFMHSSLKVPPQHLSQVEVWTLTGPLQHLYSFLFQTFCCRFAAVFGIIVLLMTQFQALSVILMASHLTLEYFGIQRSS